MRYINTFNESIYKNLDPNEHIENIEDILIEFNDNKDAKIDIYKSKLSLGQSHSRTFNIDITLDDNKIESIIKNFKGTKKYSLILSDYLDDIAEKISKRLEIFGYRLYKEITVGNKCRNLLVTYRPNKTKIK